MLRPLCFFALLPVIFERALAAVGPSTILPIVNSEISPDGFLRSAVLADGVFPGPLIQGTKGNDFSITVVDLLTDDSMDLQTSIHWHGIFQKHTNYVDGPAFVTQCPIVPFRDFLYKFNALEQAGTYWYHSHFEAQYCDGLRGPLVIYDPDDPHADLYDVDDEDTVITLADWYHFISKVAPLAPVFNSTLINGQGRYAGGPSAPLAVVNVVRGKRYRLRLVSISCDPNFTFSIDGHQLTIIEVDGNNVQPLIVDSLQIFAGQRYSVVLSATQPIGNYWIRALSNLLDKSYANFTNVAILRYFGAFPINPSPDPNVNIPTSVLPLVETNLHPLVPTPVPGKPFSGGADININLVVTPTSDLKQILVNDVSFESPTVPALLQIMSGVQNASDLLPAGSIYGLEPNKSVEITLPAGVPGGPHPIHLHGHPFHVVRGAGNSTYNFVDPVIRDVVSMGKTGDNLTIRFFTDNPGPWFLHCHIDWHLTKGFAVVFAEDVPEVSAQDMTTTAWDNLCPIYDGFINPALSRA
ncbi:laccase T2 copper depleted [Multifurca ochricompacta]|uniref:Laccase T2 copper depleted n=1 Tax=Multifurca ochricompacta TaxID=376703 RepID=A0AAD4QK96_9AGAM|nr:laccase T2 copper depleted [Multifurca ochricompacta]